MSNGEQARPGEESWVEEAEPQGRSAESIGVAVVLEEEG